MTDLESIEEELKNLKVVVKDMAAALKVLTDKDEKAQRFVQNIETILGEIEIPEDYR